MARGLTDFYICYILDIGFIWIVASNELFSISSTFCKKCNFLVCKIWGFHGGDYEECRLLGYKTPVRTSQETHYVSATKTSRLMLCKIWGIHSGDYEECRLLGYKNPVHTSLETHYVPATEPSRLMYEIFEVFTAVTMKNAVFWDVTPYVSCNNRRFGGTQLLLHQGDKNRWTRNNASCN
jgi:hypothetical protein